MSVCDCEAMIVAEEPSNYVPEGSVLYGRICAKRHPARRNVFRLQDSITDQFRSVNLNNKNKPEIVRYERRCGEIRELYAFDRSCFICGVPGKKLVRKYSTEFEIKEAFWFCFESNCPAGCPNSSKPAPKLPSVCLVGKEEIDFHGENDHERFTANLPFEITNVLPTKSGLLLERRLTEAELDSGNRNEEPLLPILFTLSHPLNEILPAILKCPDSSLGAKYASDVNMRTVFSCSELSLVLVFNPANGCHSLWQARKATADEALCAAQRLEQSICSVASVSGLDVSSKSNQTPASVLRSLISQSTRTTTDTPSSGWRPQTSQVGQSTTTGTSSSLGGARLLFATNSQSASSPASAMAATPSASSRITTRSVTAALQSPATRTLASPVVSRLMGLSSRQQQTPVPHNDLASILHGAMSPAHRVVRANQSNQSLGAADSSHYWPAEPLMPDICLDMIWTEASRRNEHGLSGQCASKAFITEDLLGHMWLCYLIAGSEQLRCLKLTVNGRDSVTAAHVTLVPCKDASNLENHMILVDPNNNLVLYTGITKIGAIHINSSTLNSPSSCMRSALQIEDRSMLIPTIMSSSRAPSDMGDMSLTEMSLSPVSETMSGMETTPQRNYGTVGSLGPCYERTFVVELVSGMRCISKLPEIAKSEVVSRCFKSLCGLLPRDKALHVYSQWCLKSSQMLGCGQQAHLELKLFLKFILGLAGFPCKRAAVFENLGTPKDTTTPVTQRKRPRKSASTPTDKDWQNLLSSDFHKEHATRLFPDVELEVSSRQTASPDQETVETTAALFGNAVAVFQALHFCYEEAKLDKSSWTLLSDIAWCLHAIAQSFGWQAYCELYQRDFSALISDRPHFVLPDPSYRPPVPRNFFLDSPFSAFNACAQFLLASKEQLSQSARPLAFQATPPKGHWRLAYATICFGLLSGKISTVTEMDRFWGKNWFEKIGLKVEVGLKVQKEVMIKELSPNERLTRFVELTKLSINDLQTYPTGVALCILDALYQNRVVPNPLCVAQKKKRAYAKFTGDGCKTTSKIVDGMAALDSPAIANLLKLRFPKDLRLADVRAMLDSSKPVRVSIKQTPGQSDQELKEHQEQYLYGACLRTCSLPFGRAMLTLRSICPLVSQSVAIPDLCTHGQLAPRGLRIDLNNADLPARAFEWAQFHNGVATGLQVTTDKSSASSTLDSAWIVYNLPDCANQLAAKDAGFLFGLGLNGHLAQLNLFNIHEYLVRGDQLSSIALLLGVAAAKRATADLQVMKMLATHLPFLLPPTLFELQIDPLIQTAAIMGVGLLYAGNGHPSLAEALLKEMVKPPLAETDPWPEREAYSLACGMALGLVTLGQGNQLNNNFGNSSEATLVDYLALYMTGGLKPQWALDSSFTNSINADHLTANKPASNHIREGQHVNVHVTAPGATLALGLMFLKTGNAAVAKLLKLPTTLSLLDQVRPDFLLLRVLSRSLILWDNILPTVDWVESQIPPIVTKFVHKICNAPDEMDEEQQIEEQWWRDLVDEELVCQAYCNIVAGSCLSIAIKFAGSANAEAFSTLLKYCQFFLPDDGKTEHEKRLLEGAGRATVHSGLNTLLVSLGTVMAGTGNLDVIRIVRMLRIRGLTEQAVGNTHLHGTYLATHMALGLLFLGGGRFTLSTSNLAVATMVCAFYPKFPLNISDNRCYLQALRHLWVLACEQRTLIPMETDSDKLAVAHVDLKFRDSEHYSNCTMSMKAPCILPELNLLDTVTLQDNRYWPIRFERGQQSWDKLRLILGDHSGILEVTRRAGYLPYHEDPQGYKSTSALAAMRKDTWQPLPFCQMENNETLEQNTDRYMASLRKWCVKQECLDLFPLLLDLWQQVHLSPLSGCSVWQLKLLLIYAKQMNNNLSIVNEEILRRFEAVLEKRIVENGIISLQCLHTYCGLWVSEESNSNQISTLSPLLSYFDIISNSEWESLKIREYRNLRTFLEKLQQSGMQLKTLIVLHQLLSN